jgi:hypothetical protein
MKKPLEEEDTLLQAGIIETSDIESKDTLYRLMLVLDCFKMGYLILICV